MFEIGTEELPATTLADIFESPLTSEDGEKENSLEKKLKKVFEDKRLSFKECRVWATPRRLVFLVREVAEAQLSKENLIKGPSKQDAFLNDGTPNEKLQGFLRSKNASLKDTEISTSQGKEYVYVRQSEPVKKTEAILPELLEQFLKSLSFPKNMRWNASGVYFPRPIRSFLCFYGDKPVKFNLAGLPVNNQTRLFIKAERKVFGVKNPASYFSLLKKQGIILDPALRKKAIQEKLEALAKSLKGKLYEDAFLLNEVNFLVENPNALSAPFHEEFLKLPLEVLTVSMARKQRIFGILDKNNRVIPHFLGVLDGAASGKDKKDISRNYEHILHAKLQDSLFFFREDVKVPLSKKREELKDLIFLKNAGSMLEKSERLVRLAKKIGAEISLPGHDQTALERACFLSKADLLTLMVGEFPELQGIIGKYYALENKESAETALAIGEQYLPRTAQDKLPETMTGSILSILDKCDLVVACFGLGNEPSSSLDPFGLRRSATAAIKIILDKKISFSFSNLLAQIKNELGATVQKDKEEALLKKLDAFFKDRFKALLADRGYREDLVEAVMASGFENIYATALRVEALSKIFGEKQFLEAWKVVERTVNILKGNRETLPAAPDRTLFTEELEGRVLKQYEEHHKAIEEATASGDYRLATSLYAKAFFDILGEFFEKVFVNAEDPNVRKNRLSLLRAVRDLYTAKIADLSKIHLNV